MTTFLGVLILVCALFLIVSVLLQSSKNHRMSGVISGGADTFFGKQKGKTIDAVLSKITAVISVIFCLLVLALYVITSRAANKSPETTEPIVLDDTSITTTIPEADTTTEEGAVEEEASEAEISEDATEEVTEETDVEATDDTAADTTDDAAADTTDDAAADTAETTDTADDAAADTTDDAAADTTEATEDVETAEDVPAEEATSEEVAE